VNYFSRGIEVREMGWGSPPVWGAMPNFTLNDPSVAAVGDARSSRALELAALGRGRASRIVQLRVTLPSSMSGRIDVYDVLGRRVRTLARGALRAGDSVVSWDGLALDGAPAGNGMYFARLATPAGVRSTKVILMR